MSCVPCQAGTSSSNPAAPSAASCTPCAIGQYSNSVGSKTCASCGTNQCATIGSITPSLSSPSTVDFNRTVYGENGNPVTAASPFIVGWIYVGLFGGFVLLSGLIAIIFQKKLRRPVLAAAVILRTPAVILRVADSSNRLVEEPSFFRGIVGIWVSGGVILVTAYQIDIFFSQGRTEDTAVQPGTVFTNGSSTSSVGTTLSLSLVLFQTPITRNTTAFTLTFSAVNSKSLGLLSGRPTTCVVDPTFLSLTVTYAFAAPLSFTSASSVVFSATSANQSPLFSHGVSYNLSLSSYQGMSVKMWETLTNDPANQLTGDVTVALSAVPTEYLYNTDTQSIGYSYTHFSSSTEDLNAATSSTYNVTFTIPVERYFYQIKNIQTTSNVLFLTSLLGLGGGMIAGGSLFANANKKFSLARFTVDFFHLLLSPSNSTTTTTAAAESAYCNHELFLPSHPDDLSLSSLSFTITRGRVKDERLEQSAREVQQWIETLIGEPIGKGGSGSGVEELMDTLKSGVVLCKVANLVKPGSLPPRRSRSLLLLLLLLLLCRRRRRLCRWVPLVPWIMWPSS